MSRSAKKSAYMKMATLPHTAGSEWETFIKSLITFILSIEDFVDCQFVDMSVHCWWLALFENVGGFKVVTLFYVFKRDNFNRLLADHGLLEGYILSCLDEGTLTTPTKNVLFMNWFEDDLDSKFNSRCCQISSVKNFLK